MNEKSNKQEQKKIIDNIYYQKNKEKKKEQRKNRYKEQQKLARREMKKRVQKYSQVENYKVLMTLKEYTLLNKDKQRKWLDFNWTLKDLADNGVHNTSEIMRLCELGEILLRDYRETAKKEVVKGKDWGGLSWREKEKLAKYWGAEKVREEMVINEGLEEIERKGEEEIKEIERAKRHEELGKEYCHCSWCEEQRKIKAEVVAEKKKIWTDYEKEEKPKK